jgi:hypothetical protein
MRVCVPGALANCMGAGRGLRYTVQVRIFVCVCVCVRACLEHWQDVGEPADGCVILYRYVCVGYLVYACVRARCVYIIVHNNIRGQLGKFLYALWIIRPQIGKLQILHNMFIDIKFGACQFWGVCLVCCGVQAIF